MRVVIAGGAGALGRRLATDFEGAGHDVVILTRSPKSDLRFRQALWDGRAVGDWASELEGAIVVNLAGELVDRRPTATNIELLRRSRVEPTAALAAASRACGVPPRLWLQMSTLAIYGDAGNDVIDETHPPADGPPQMAGVATAWEAATKAVVADRIVRLRTGVVLDNDTPAFNRLTRLARWGLGGRLGPGDQWVSWIHIDDFLASVRFLLDAQAVDGIVPVPSLNPVRNIAPEHVIGSYEYAHPVFDMAAIRAQQQVAKLQGQQYTWFCGAWTGYGFHEDGLKSGLAVAQQLLAAMPATLAEAA